MNQAKARLGVDQDDEEEKKDDVKIGADLDDSTEPTMSRLTIGIGVMQFSLT
jgi:hypothetical protein